MLINNQLSRRPLPPSRCGKKALPVFRPETPPLQCTILVVHSLVVSWLVWSRLSSAVRSSPVFMRMKVEFIWLRFFTFCDLTVVPPSMGSRSVPLTEISPRLWLTFPVMVDSCRRLITRGLQLLWVLILLRGEFLFSRYPKSLGKMYEPGPGVTTTQRKPSGSPTQSVTTCHQLGFKFKCRLIAAHCNERCRFKIYSTLS